MIADSENALTIRLKGEKNRKNFPICTKNIQLFEKSACGKENHYSKISLEQVLSIDEHRGDFHEE